MALPLRILIIQDSERETLLVVQELRGAGYQVRFRRVTTAESMNTALDQEPWNLVISDFDLSSFSPIAAIEVLNKRGLDLPFIIVSDTVGEDRAVEAIKAGANDYILKGNLKRLTPTVERELREAEDRRERRRAEAYINQLAFYDHLTKLPNRQFFLEILKKSILQAQRANRSVALLFLDLDRFKLVNDLLGHFTGDELLKAIAIRLKDKVRSSDTIARLGGDEFTIILENVRHHDSVAGLAKKILQALLAPFQLAGRDLFITTSIGIALYPNDANDSTSLIKCADAAMYAAKEHRGSFRFYSPSMNTTSMNRLVLETDIRRALEKGDYVLHYQPIVEFATRKIVAVEALLHWQHPERGLLPPSSFIPLVEGSDLIFSLGEWVIRTACRQLREWQNNGISWLRLAVNFAPHQLYQDGLVNNLHKIIFEAGVPPHSLDLELTERALVLDKDQAIATLLSLRNMGIQIHLDDFGAAYSSLEYLRRLPITGLKIDRSFIRGIWSDSQDAKIVTMIINLAHSLNLKIIAEGVETLKQAAVLQAKGCTEMQGYYFSPPLPAETLTTLLATGKGILAHKA